MAAVIPYALMAAGTVMEGNAAAQESKIMEAQHNKQANASRAEGNRAAIEIRRQGEGITSDAAASMAASGGVTTDVGAISDLSKMDKIIDYNALSAIYEGNRQADDDKFAGAVARWKGKSAKNLSRIKAASTLMSGATDAFKSYSGGK